jgi:two-component system response regulator PhoP
MRFLIVEDHIGMADQIYRGLCDRGFNAKVVDNGEDGLHELMEIDYSLAVVDLGLPGISGLELIKRLRQAGNRIPVVVLTARDDVESIVQAMEAGADDYLKKPVYMEELIAHIQAVLRRVLGDPKLDTPTLKYGPLTLDMQQKLVLRDKKKIELTRAEYEIIEHLWRNSGKVQSKKTIADSYQRDPGADPKANSVEGLVGRIKRKIDPEKSLKPIATVRGQGYMFNEPDS